MIDFSHATGSLQFIDRTLNGFDHRRDHPPLLEQAHQAFLRLPRGRPLACLEGARRIGIDDSTEFDVPDAVGRGCRVIDHGL